MNEAPVIEKAVSGRLGIIAAISQAETRILQYEAKRQELLAEVAKLEARIKREGGVRATKINSLARLDGNR